MKTITMVLNEPAVKSWTYGWVSCSLDVERSRDSEQKWFKVVLTKEQYNAYPGSVYDPWLDDKKEDCTKHQYPIDRGILI